MAFHRVFVVLLLCAAAHGCSSRVVKSDDNGPPAYRMDDGGLCKAPAGYPDVLEQPGTRQVRSLFLASTSPVVTAAGVTDLPSLDALDAALYLSCGEYAAGEMSTNVFRQQRKVYQELRLRHLERGIQSWLDEPDGYAAPGKVCAFLFNGDVPDVRNLTRMVPQQATADDCALYVSTKDGSHVRLGCSAGGWNVRWAPQALRVGPNGRANRSLTLADTQYVPHPDCGWG